MFLWFAGGATCRLMDRAAQRRWRMSRRQRTIISGASSRCPWAARFRCHSEQGREQCPIRPVQVRRPA